MDSTERHIDCQYCTAHWTIKLCWHPRVYLIPLFRVNRICICKNFNLVLSECVCTIPWIYPEKVLSIQLGARLLLLLLLHTTISAVSCAFYVPIQFIHSDIQSHQRSLLQMCSVLFVKMFQLNFRKRLFVVAGNRNNTQTHHAYFGAWPQSAIVLS